SCLSSGGRERGRRSVPDAMAQHGMEHVYTPSSEAEHGLIVSLALCSFAVVVGTRWRMSQAGERRQEQRVLEAVVTESTRHVGVDRRARFPGRRTEPGVGS